MLLLPLRTTNCSNLRAASWRSKQHRGESLSSRPILPAACLLCRDIYDLRLSPELRRCFFPLPPPLAMLKRLQPALWFIMPVPPETPNEQQGDADVQSPQVNSEHNDTVSPLSESRPPVSSHLYGFQSVPSSHQTTSHPTHVSRSDPREDQDSYSSPLRHHRRISSTRREVKVGCKHVRVLSQPCGRELLNSYMPRRH